METGMLWYDDSKRSLKEKITVAVDHYSEKYGEKPTLCFVHPSMLERDTLQGNGIELREARNVMPSHFWLGIDLGDNGESNGKRKHQ